MGKPICPRFSEHFGLNRSQQDLDFVDILPETDLPLYLDPYAFKVGTSDLAIECNNLVVDYFDTVLQCVCTNNRFRGRQLLDNLGEPDETRLGVSGEKPQGRGVGRHQAKALYDKLADSLAAKTGLLRDLSDCELMIPGISQDKISDITTNIIREELATFTTEQCRIYGIPMRRVSRGVAWSEELHNWVNAYADLPMYNGSHLLLVPKWMVRRHIAVDHQEYYQHFVLEFLQYEYLEAGSGLVEVLKNGRQRVTKKSLEQIHKCTKDFLREFSEEHPDVFRQYREHLNSKLSPINNSELEKLVRSVQQLRGGGSIFFNFGSQEVGDKNTVHGNVTGSVVGSGTVNARDITLYNKTVTDSDLDADLKKVLITAREAVESSGLTQTDEADVNDDLGRITVELQKPTPEPGLIRRYYNRIKDVAAGIASVLSSAKAIKDALDVAA